MREKTMPPAQLRPHVPALDARLQQEQKILDHGFIRLIDYMGDDEAIVEAARLSYGRGTRKKHENEGLIRYLMRHRHTSPFEMCELKLHIKLPIFIARQWLRHRTASVNEYSARYSILDREFYLPDPQFMAYQDKGNKQARDQKNTLPAEKAERILALMKQDALQCYQHYEEMLAEEEGEEPLARELARMNLPVNFYTQFYWKIDLHNLLHFVSLRAHSHAQYEIRVYADAIMALIKLWTPLAAQAFEDYVLNAHTLSARALACLKIRFKEGKMPSFEESHLSKGEWQDFLAFIDRLEQK